MISRKPLAALMIAVVALALAAAGSLAAPRQPMVLATVGDTFAAPYDAVWDATLKSLGVLKLPVADKATGRIETEPFPFSFTFATGQGGASQVAWIALQIQLIRAAENRTVLQVVPQVHYAFYPDVTPGPTNNPWLDLFAKIRTRLGPHS